jgi:hypothetical protein
VPTIPRKWIAPGVEGAGAADTAAADHTPTPTAATTPATRNRTRLTFIEPPLDWTNNG